MGLKRNRSHQPNISITLESPVEVEETQKPTNENENLNVSLAETEEYPDETERERSPLINHENDNVKPGLSKNLESRYDDEVSSQHRPFHRNYPDEKVFAAALELFNKRNEVCHKITTSPSVLQKWICKGDIRVSFQLCVLCYDIGKLRNDMERYYLDVLEISMYRTILCKRCLGDILHKYIGNCLAEIEKLTEEQNKLL